MDTKYDAIDPKKLERGAWDYVDDVTEVRVRRASYEPFRNLLNQLREEAIAELKLGEDDDIPAKRSKQILARAMAEELLTGWRNMLNGGEELPYSKEAAYDLLIDERHEQFKGQILLKANDLELFRVKRRESLGKS